MQYLKKIATVIALSLSLTLVAQEFLPCATPATTVEAASVKISKKNATIIKGQTLKLKVNGTKSKVKWSSSKKSVATVSSKGVVKAKKNGIATITAKIGKKSLKCKITVETPSISKKSISLNTGKTYTLKMKGTKQKVTWSSNNKSVASVSSKGKVSAKKAGSAKITAKVGGKKYTCSVTVKQSASGDGTRTNPLSAYKAYTTDIYDYGQYLGKFKIQLLDYKDGKEAYNYVMQNPYNPEPTRNQEYIYLKYKISYISGSDQVAAYNVVNHFSNLFNKNANYQLDNNDWGCEFEDIDDMIDVSLYPGGSSICSKAILVKSGNTPITYRLETGFDKKNYKPIYTWFTTK